MALPFADASVDLAFLVAVLGGVPDSPAAMAELFCVVLPGGRLHLTEQPSDPDFIPLPAMTAMTAMAEAAGFRAGRH